MVLVTVLTLPGVVPAKAVEGDEAKAVEGDEEVDTRMPTSATATKESVTCSRQCAENRMICSI